MTREPPDAAEGGTLFADADAWDRWLAQHHATSRGLQLRFAKKASALTSVTPQEAVEVALRWGWIDGRADRYDADSWLMRFTPRARRSLWSKINRARAEALIRAGRMMPSGLDEVERARADGRWDAAYDSVRGATVPLDLQERLDALPEVKRAFDALDSRNRYAILHRIQTVKRAETRAKRIEQFVAMLERGETIYP